METKEIRTTDKGIIVNGVFISESLVNEIYDLQGEGYSKNYYQNMIRQIVMELSVMSLVNGDLPHDKAAVMIECLEYMIGLLDDITTVTKPNKSENNNQTI
ncbi:MAG: hypothetical protein PUB21_07965 [Bacteroidales bacterium]|nr:hypothetical protein [Bacteroidales bacterium]